MNLLPVVVKYVFLKFGGRYDKSKIEDFGQKQGGTAMKITIIKNLPKNKKVLIDLSEVNSA